eukprot:TRINITY_DN16035_c0_g1::TRINITY_DN16035_c0_g1_i1::g.13814::m.13814 TRINITY_DN16035_c0_g1::TRINITY_DN16035_c0_g1_i1::g.13814  ORF type:complete len:439 (-),score=42.81,sp/A8MS41/CCR4D_ARATH/26.71/1e-27,Exo_endo_phos/PF03372.18/5.6e-18 TRINITY_DN16035_c0_g1_i1:438-1676(-)
MAFSPRYLVSAHHLGKAATSSLPQVPRSIKILTFNILAGNLGTSDHFPYVDPSRLEWSARRELIVSQILAVDPDVFCLQELNDYEEFFRDRFPAAGYASIYIKRPSLHHSPWSGENKHDGCGIFFKADKFILQARETIQYEDRHDRVGLAALLGPKDPLLSPLLIATTHLYWDSNKIETQIAELKQFEEWLEMHYQNCTMQLGKAPVVAVCGDFNNTPSSQIYKYMVSEFMRSTIPSGFRSAYDTYQWKMELQTQVPSHIGSDCSSTSPSNHHSVSYPATSTCPRTITGLVSPGADVPAACSSQHSAPFSDVSREEGLYEPQFTAFNFRRSQTIDYIWFTKGSMDVVALLELPAEDELRKESGPEGWVGRVNQELHRKGRALLPLDKNLNGIPNSQYGSDHLPIAAILQFPA